MTRRRDDSIDLLAPITSISEIAPVVAVRSVGRRRTAATGDDGKHPHDHDDAAADNDLSTFAQELSQLAEVAQSDPDRFVAIVTSIVRKLTRAASSATLGEQMVLRDVADQFARAARERDLSNFHPATDVAIHQASTDGALHTGAAAYRSPSDDASVGDLRSMIARIVQQALDAAPAVLLGDRDAVDV